MRDPFTQPVTQFQFSILIGRECVAFHNKSDRCYEKTFLNVFASITSVRLVMKFTHIPRVPARLEVCRQAGIGEEDDDEDGCGLRRREILIIDCALGKKEEGTQLEGEGG